MARKGLPKKYAKMGFKDGWAAYKRTKKRTSRRIYKATHTGGSKRKSNRRRSMPKRNYRKRARGFASNPMVKGAGISVGGNIVGNLVGINPQLAKLGLSAVGPFKNKTVLGYMIGEMFQTGGFGGLSSALTGGGAIGGIQGAI